MNFKNKENCICCDSQNLKLILDLRSQPLANSYHKEDEKLEEYPLGLNLCNNCYHLQLSHIVNPDLLFRNYLYASGTTKTLREFFDWFAKFSTQKTNKKYGKVLDIACNDGSQLNSFKNIGWDTYGIDPAENLYKISSKNHSVKCGYFNDTSFGYTKFDIITAQNVFAHTENALEFLNRCSSMMQDDALLFIQTSQSEMIKNNQFDTVYHEHLSFFNINSFETLCRRSNLSLIDVVKVPVHGVSYVFILRKGGRTELENLLINNLISVESEYGLTKQKTYETYSYNVNKLVDNFVSEVTSYRKNGYKIVGYGAAAKGMTFLNFSKVTLDYIIDDNPMKHHLLTPGTNIPIVSVEKLKEHGEEEKILFIPLAWNFFDEISQRIKAVRNNSNDMFLRYFPDVKIFN